MQNHFLKCITLLLIPLFVITMHARTTGINSLNDDIIENASYKTNGHHKEYGDTTVVEIRSEGVELSYSVTEIRAKAGSILKIVYINDSDMSHNIVLVREEKDIRPVGIAALQAISNDWIPEKEMDRILAYSALAYSGDTVEVVFEVPPPGTYPYICTYSAHWTQMQGRLISTE